MASLFNALNEDSDGEEFVEETPMQQFDPKMAHQTHHPNASDPVIIDLVENSDIQNTMDGEWTTVTASTHYKKVNKHEELEERRVMQNMQTLQLLFDMPCTSQYMIVLAGIPGCGKSTFCRRLLSSMSPDYARCWEVCNQDTLGSRDAVLKRAETSLRQGKCVIIDRCNFDTSQRLHWINLANQYNICALCIVMPNYIDTELCTIRAFERGNSDNVHPGDVDWQAVCNRMKNDFHLPGETEGFIATYICHNEDELETIQSTIVNVEQNR